MCSNPRPYDAQADEAPLPKRKRKPQAAYHFAGLLVSWLCWLCWLCWLFVALGLASSFAPLGLLEHVQYAACCMVYVLF